ncbi:helix-turn-helix transcriptional regulator [Chitinibacter tainanensis]|uniref:helix-turn-helix transcriptional regulator n=1 Tax=Chitinibacter tainanensis TaxID=230667 RepID=UPI00040D85FE|nr:AraC family transcriptional regulator [Chitinibacter tainanensis]
MPATRSASPTPASYTAGSTILSSWQQPLADGCCVAASTLRGGHAHRVDSEAGQRLIVLLQGELTLGFGERRIQLAHSVARGAEVLLVNLTEATEFAREITDCTLERKVCLHIPAGWLDAHGLHGAGEQEAALQQFTRQHLAVRQWQAEPALVALAEQLLAGPSASPLLARLQRESLAFELLAMALGQVQPASAPSLPAHISRRLEAVRALLDSGAADELSLSDIAAQACMSVATLQRHFRRQFGTSVFDYLRQQKLWQARQRLQRGEVSVTRAALDAGYTSPANFATAFRRAFGMAPSECRAA